MPVYDVLVYTQTTPIVGRISAGTRLYVASKGIPFTVYAKSAGLAEEEAKHLARVHWGLKVSGASSTLNEWLVDTQG